MGDDLDKQVARALKQFWQTREAQQLKQGGQSGRKDSGARAAVTGGKHLDGFVQLCEGLLVAAGISKSEVFTSKRRELPGFYRAEKSWDLIVVVHGQLLAVVEFKAHIGPSFGNNCNNRCEEALGNAADLWAAYREGAFNSSPRPWLGYLFILEECEASQRPVRVKQPHFGAFAEFQGASYAQRYEILLTKLLRERMYDGAALILSDRRVRQRGKFSTPTEELGVRRFAAGLTAHVSAFANSRANPTE